MEKKVRYTLGKADRLKSRKAIDCLFKTGKSFTIFPFRILYLLSEPAPAFSSTPASRSTSSLQAGFTVSSRNFKKAVDRNRIKRLMREAYRLQKNKLQAIPEFNQHNLSLFFIYTGKELPEYELVYEKIDAVLNRLIRITSEKK